MRLAREYEVRSVFREGLNHMVSYPDLDMLGDEPDAWGLYYRDHEGPHAGELRHVEDYSTLGDAVLAQKRAELGWLKNRLKRTREVEITVAETYGITRFKRVTNQPLGRLLKHLNWTYIKASEITVEIVSPEAS